jgi:capsular exopolysaccharide synthesis family protein
MNIPTHFESSEDEMSPPLNSLLAGGVPVPETRPAILQNYIRILKQRKWLIIGAIAVALLLGLLATLVATPKYTATTRIEISRTSDKVVNLETVSQESQVDDAEFYQTQYGLLQAYSLAERVVRDLKLQDDKQFFEAFDATPQGDDAFSTSKRDSRIRSAASILLRHVDISPIRGSRLVDIRFTSPSNELSARIANSWAKNFIESNLQRRFEASAYARNFLEERLNQLRGRLEQSERAAVSYAAQQGMISVSPTTTKEGADSGTGQRSLVADNLARLNAELATATASRVQSESRLRGNVGAASPEALASPVLANLRQRRAEAAADYAKLLTQFEPGYPQAVALKSQIDDLDRAISREEGRISQSLRNDYQSSVARESELQSRVNELKSQLIAQQRKGIEYNIYQRDADTNRQLYDALLQRYKEIGVAGGVGTNNISVVDAAQVPQAPSSPNLVLNIVLALVVGGIVGFGGALALEQIDEVFADPWDVMSKLNVPLLGTVPRSEESPVEAAMDPKTPLTEAYVAIQTALQFSTTHGFPRSLMVTSTRPAEGKTTTSLSLALAQARRKMPVILLDSDMRSPSIHGTFGAANDVGLSNYLAGEDSLDDLIKRQVAPQLDAMYAGPPPPNAADLLADERFARLIEQLMERYRYVIIDAPPVMGLADAPLIASAVEATVYVIEAHSTPATLIRLALQRLASSKAHLVGVALTKFQAAKSNYGYGYEYGYAYDDDRDK